VILSLFRPIVKVENLVLGMLMLKHVPMLQEFLLMKKLLMKLLMKRLLMKRLLKNLK